MYQPTPKQLRELEAGVYNNLAQMSVNSLSEQTLLSWRTPIKHREPINWHIPALFSAIGAVYGAVFVFSIM